MGRYEYQDLLSAEKSTFKSVLGRLTLMSPPNITSRPWLVACDESGVHGTRHHGFGTLWMPWDRRGDFKALIDRLREETGFVSECKWNKISKGPRLRFCKALIDEFFSRTWLAFHCIVIEKSIIDREKHQGDYDLARRKHFTMLLSNKIKRVMRKNGNDVQFHVWVDPIASRYDKAHEAVEVITANIAAKSRGVKPSLSVRVHDSKTTPSIQLCDLLLGAVLDAFNDPATAEAKRQVAQHIAGHLEWPDLQADTSPESKKFNIWKFHDPIREQRRTATTRRTPFDQK